MYSALKALVLTNINSITLLNLLKKSTESHNMLNKYKKNVCY